MAKMIYELLKTVAGKGQAIDDVKEWLENLFGALNEMLTSDLMTLSFTTFAGVAFSILLLFFLLDLLGLVERDMLTFQKLVIQFIKLMVGATILLCLPNIITGLVDLGHSFFEYFSSDSFQTASASSGTKKEISFSFGSTVYTSSTFPKWATVQDLFKEEYGIGGIIGNLGVCFIALLAWILRIVIYVAGCFVATSCVVKILLRAIMSPIAVVQCFEEGTRSTGIRYLKGFFAEVLSLGLMVAALVLSQSLSNSLLLEAGTNKVITFDNLDEVLGILTIGRAFLPQLAGVGAMMAVEKLAHDVTGG